MGRGTLTWAVAVFAVGCEMRADWPTPPRAPVAAIALQDAPAVATDSPPVDDAGTEQVALAAELAQWRAAEVAQKERRRTDCVRRREAYLAARVRDREEWAQREAREAAREHEQMLLAAYQRAHCQMTTEDVVERFACDDGASSVVRVCTRVVAKIHWATCGVAAPEAIRGRHYAIAPSPPHVSARRALLAIATPPPACDDAEDGGSDGY